MFNINRPYFSKYAASNLLQWDWPGYPLWLCWCKRSSKNHCLLRNFFCLICKGAVLTLRSIIRVCCGFACLIHAVIWAFYTAGISKWKMDRVLHLKKGRKERKCSFHGWLYEEIKTSYIPIQKLLSVASYLTQVGPVALSISVIFVSKSSFHLHCNSDVKAFNLLNIIKMLKGQSKNALARLKTLADLYT